MSGMRLDQHPSGRNGCSAESTMMNDVCAGRVCTASVSSLLVQYLPLCTH